MDICICFFTNEIPFPYLLMDLEVTPQDLCNCTKIMKNRLKCALMNTYQYSLMIITSCVGDLPKFHKYFSSEFNLKFLCKICMPKFHAFY